MRYRPEIDGLRAIAVIPVILFHAGFSAIPGGFVGVDVFFVISGYLITSLLLEEMEEGRFSLLGFYERRARRILPALFLVSLASLPFAWLLFFPSDMRNFAESLAAVSLFSSNILFWLESGYFDGAAELKPLLHTWSLAVEEQFYILFPLLLLAAGKLGRARLPWVLAPLIAISFALANWSSRYAPEAGFYLLPSRAWELLLGAILAVWSGHVTCRSTAGREGLSLCGLVLIVLPVLLYDTSTPFPGLSALPPTIGTCLLILFCREGSLCHQLLSNRLLSGCGLLSYSAYLWHQPLFAFARYGRLEAEPLWQSLLLCLAVFPLSYLTWRWIEKPFRRRGDGAFPILPPLAGMIFCFTAFFAAAVVTNGFAFRATATEQTVQAFQEYPYEELYLEGICHLKGYQRADDLDSKCFVEEIGAPMLWGDSHAAALAAGFRKEIGQVTQVTASGCPPLIGEVMDTAPRIRRNCKKINDHIAASLSRAKPSRIYLHANWLFYIGRFDALEKTVSRIRQESPESDVWILGGVPQWRPDLPTIFLAEGLRLNLEELYLPPPELEKVSTINEALRLKADELSVGYLDPLQFFCRNGACQVTLMTNGVIELTAWDYGHLTITSAAKLARWLEENAR